MKLFFLTVLVGIVCGTIDIAPMIRMKLDKFSIISAFVFYLILPFIIYNTTLFKYHWWLKGGLITFLLALPIIILVAKEDVKSTLPIAVMSVVLGSLIGIIGKFIIKI